MSFSLTTPPPPDIREAAVEVNDRLKKLILPEDDKDALTDTEDKAKGEDTCPSLTRPKCPPSPQIVAPMNLVHARGGSVGGGGSPKSSPKTSPKMAASASAEVSSSTGEGKEREGEPPKFHLLSVLAVLIPHMKFTQQETRKETLRWIMWLHRQLPKRVCLCVCVCGGGGG